MKGGMESEENFETLWEGKETNLHFLATFFLIFLLSLIQHSLLRSAQSHNWWIAYLNSIIGLSAACWVGVWLVRKRHKIRYDCPRFLFVSLFIYYLRSELWFSYMQTKGIVELENLNCKDYIGNNLMWWCLKMIWRWPLFLW